MEPEEVMKVTRTMMKYLIGEKEGTFYYDCRRLEEFRISLTNRTGYIWRM